MPMLPSRRATGYVTQLRQETTRRASEGAGEERDAGKRPAGHRRGKVVTTDVHGSPLRLPRARRRQTRDCGTDYPIFYGVRPMYSDPGGSSPADPKKIRIEGGGFADGSAVPDWTINCSC